MRKPITLSLVMAIGALAPACGSKSTLATKPDAAHGSGGGGGQIPMTGGTSGPKLDGSPGSRDATVSGGSMTGGAPGTGGSTSTGGRPGTGGLPATGGGPGTGGIRSPDGGPADDGPRLDIGPVPDGAATSPMDAIDLVSCWRDGGGGFAWEARACSSDSDCSVVEITTCCGYWVPGLATNQLAKYSACRSRSSCPPNYDCFAFPYETDTCQVDAHNQWYEYQRDVKVQCLARQCTTSLKSYCKDAGA